MSACTTLAPVSVRDRNRRSGSSGVAAVAWRTTNPASSATASAPVPRVRALAQPCSAAPTMADTPTIRPEVTRAAPARSKPARSPIPRSGATVRSVSSTTARPSGTFTRNTQCQSSASVTRPPTRLPMAPPAAAEKLNAPIALARSPGSANSVTIMPRITAEASAPPTPWTNRAATS